MAGKSKSTPQGEATAAAIFSDMSADGPDIGTLVVIVDRAKNLPNRKSIGKQDPYCAARLGKEARKTDTDMRGGQTPKWDQELRFTVHDSPDYYQLKISVFHDDKKTELIGEAWIPLQSVIVQGGGQNDGWHNLNCKGKYAGEILIEITYYDTRPKQEKISEKVRQGTPTSTQDGGRESLGGPRQLKAPVKRRPLPSDPTGASPSPSETPEYVQTPPSQQPQQPLQQPQKQRGYQTPTYIQTQSPLQAVEYNTPPQFSRSQSQLQQIEYNTPSLRLSQSQRSYPQTPLGHEPTPLLVSHSQQGYQQSPVRREPHPGSLPLTPEGWPTNDHRYEAYNRAEDNEYDAGPRNDDIFQSRRRSSYSQSQPQQVVYELPTPEQFGPPPSPGGPPPPPPVHRSNHGSPAVMGNSSYELPHNGVPGNLQYDSSPRDGYRKSMPAYVHSGSYQGYTPPKQQRPVSDHNDYQQSPPRHHSYDDRYGGTNDMVQSPTEAVVSPMSAVSQNNSFSPVSNFSSYHSGIRNSHFEDSQYDQVPAPAPLNLNSRGSASSARQSVNPVQYQAYRNESGSTGSPMPYRGRSYVPQEPPTSTPYTHQHHKTQRRESDEWTRTSATAVGVYIPPVPASLVPGMDPSIAQDIANRIYNDNRRSHNHNTAVPPRNQYPEQSNYRQHSVSPHEARQQPYVSAAATYDDGQITNVTNVYTTAVKPRATSPDVRIPMRKSVSPQGDPASGEGRKLSTVPFGPDAYDALNPNVEPTPAISSSKQNTRGHPAVDPDAKIIMHDGREVDPSDHLPEGSWAPEPEVKPPRQRPQQPNSTQLPGVGQPVSTPVRPVGRPLSLVVAASSPMYLSGAISDPPTPVAAPGRNRLQKKPKHPQPQTNSSPLAPITPHQDNSFATRSLPRAQTLDFAGENEYGSYGGSPGLGRGFGNGPPIPPKGNPPIPAKIPMNHGPPPPPPEENAWALLEEMKSIDLGTGRARRRGYDARFS